MNKIENEEAQKHFARLKKTVGSNKMCIDCIQIGAYINLRWNCQIWIAFNFATCRTHKLLFEWVRVWARHNTCCKMILRPVGWRFSSKIHQIFQLIDCGNLCFLIHSFSGILVWMFQKNLKIFLHKKCDPDWCAHGVWQTNKRCSP